MYYLELEQLSIIFEKKPPGTAFFVVNPAYILKESKTVSDFHFEIAVKVFIL